MPQQAGVPVDKLRRLCLKELVDNALDAGAEVHIKERVPGRYVIEDDGRGFINKEGKPATPQEIADLFSISRPLMSSKQFRKPQRGALGNGLRVVGGSVLSSGGTLIVTTRDQRLTITPHAIGDASVEIEPANHPTIGTRIEISFGPDMPEDENALGWARWAIAMAKGGPTYVGNSSAYWFDRDSFFELVHGAEGRSVRSLVERLDGCSGAKAAEVAAAFMQRSCVSLTHDETTRLLLSARAMTDPVAHRRLGSVGKLDTLPPHHAQATGTAVLGIEPQAHVPFVVEAWAENAESTAKGSSITICINRTPITGNASVFDNNKEFVIYGCGLRHIIDTPIKTGKWRLVLNITTPYMPITTHGKEPNLQPFVEEICFVLAQAIKKAHRDTPKKDSSGLNQKSVVYANIEIAAAKASGGGLYRFAQRQLLYVLRPIVWEKLQQKLKTNNFTKIITEYEAEHGPILNMYRDNRGALYQPHTGEGDIPVGTLMVEDYERPPWTFNKIVYVEKQGFFETLKAEKWPERYDCALLTGKGYSSRAIRDLIDILAEHDEPVQVFCVHDADAAGTMIMQTLQKATMARGARKIEIINLGLEAWEAEDMELEVEEFEVTEKRRPVADYVLEREDGEKWDEWFQSNRYELNAMTTPQFLEWLEGKMEEHAVGKVVPPPEVIAEEAQTRLKAELRTRITARILREANLDAQVDKAMTEVKVPKKLLTAKAVRTWLDREEEESWRACVDEAVETALEGREV